MSRLVVLALLTLLIVLPVSAAPPAASDPEQKVVAEINKAIDNGVQYLRRTRDETSQWESYWITKGTDMDGGITALATLAMLNCQLPADDPAVAKPLEFLRKVELRKTYVVALITMCLAEARNPKDLPRIQTNVDWFVKTARRSGGKLTGWSYPDTQGLERPDASNTQYALLGLYAGKMAGAKIDDTLWKEIQDLYLTTMMSEGKQSGSWSYVQSDRESSFTMTVAGVCGLLIARMAMSESGQKLNADTGVAASCGVYPEGDAIRKGMNWIGREFAFDKARASKSLFYNVYGIERVGRLSGQRFIGDHDWYREGCDFLVLKPGEYGQRSNGSWAALTDSDFRGVNIISTSFALLFLSKGRSPVLISKMAHGESVLTGEKGRQVLIEKNEPVPGVTGWNRKHNDVRNITDFAAREVFKNLPLGWQVYDPRRKEFNRSEELLQEVGLLVQSPILYFNGHEEPKLNDQQKDILKKYIEEGGFVLAEACCGSKPFANGFRRLIAELFPNNELKPMAADHAIWRSHFLVPPTEFPKLESLSRGCRTVLVFSPEPLAGYWEEMKFMPKSGQPATNRGQYAFQLAANVIAYATGKEPPKRRLAQKPIVSSKADEKSPRQGFVQLVQLNLDEPAPAESALRNLTGYLREIARLDMVPPPKDRMRATDPNLHNFKFLYLHGRKAFDLDGDAVENLKANLQTGGLLLADACCGSEAFDTSFRKAVGKLFPDLKLDVIPLDDPLYSEKVNGVKIESVERREKAADAKSGVDVGYERLPPKLEGIKIDGRWAIIYSRYDIGCALEGHKSSDCLGHSPDSAKQLAAAAVLYSLKR
jgi:hypothetical protein